MYHYYENLQTVTTLSGIIALVCAILSFIYLLPEKNRPKLNNFLRGVADIFNFKSLLLEKILKFTYIVVTIYLICFGFFGMIMLGMGTAGLFTMILGPIIIRIIYEASMMFIILVKNTSDINKNISKMVSGGADASFVAPASVKVCPNCGATITDTDTAFCTNCGSKL